MSHNEAIQEIIAAWPEVLAMIRDYDESFPYASLEGDDEKVYRMSRAVKVLKGE